MVMPLCILISILICIYTFVKCMSPAGIIVNHILLFSIGFWYYLIFPIIVGETIPEIGGVLWESLYKNISDSKLTFYVILLFGLYFVFMLSNMLPISSQSEKYYVFSKWTLYKWQIISFVYFLYMAYKAKSDLFKGYTENNGKTNYVGTMSALLLMIFSVYFIYSLKSQKKNFYKSFINPLLVVYLISSIVLLGFGGRLYIVTSFVSLIVFMSTFYKPLHYWKAAVITALGFLGIGIIGIWRIGMSFSILNGLQLISLESVFTSFSLVHFLDNYQIPIIKFPYPLLSSFINLIPTVLLPDKASMMIGLQDVGYEVFNPLGAVNAFMSFMCNFGYIGTCCFIAIMTVLLRYLKANKSDLSQIIYSCISANLAFTFFRDPFSASLIKNIFEFSFLVPLLLTIFCSIQTNKGKLIRRKLTN